MVISLTLESICSGGGHATIGVAIDGGAKRIMAFDVDELRGPIEDKEAFASNLVKMAVSGLTRQQARTKLLAGVTVTI